MGLDYLTRSANGCEITNHTAHNSRHIFEVKNQYGHVHTVFISLSCTCRYMSTTGIVRSKICGEIKHCLDHIVSNPSNFHTNPIQNPIQEKRNIAIQLIRVSSRKINKIRTGKNESKQHAAKKEEICKQLDQLKKHYVCEAIFIKPYKGRADIFVLDDCKVIEIIKSESMESIEEKRENYPSCVEIELVRA